MTTGSPDAAHVVDYLTRYEKRYDLPVVRPVRVSSVSLIDGGRFQVRAVPGRDAFRGRQLHTVDYDGPEPCAGQRVAVVGGGNSGAQILAELSTVADTVWITQRRPRFLPDDVDGRVLFSSRRAASPPAATASRTPAAGSADSATSSWSRRSARPGTVAS